MNKATLPFVFIAGGIIGSLAAAFGTKKYFEKKANDRADSEIESMREMFRKKEERIETITNEKVEKRAYEIITERYSKTDDQKISENKEKIAMEERPYVIDPEEYGDLGYKQVSLNYYDDGVLTYENDEVIENVDELVGKDSLTHFGEYEDDTVYVRNDNLRTDFEILADTRRYADIYC